MLGKEEKVGVERKENGRRINSWAAPETSAMERIMYGLPPAIALDLASSYLLNKARLNLVDQKMEQMENQAKPSQLMERLPDFLKKAEGEWKV